MSDHDDPKLTAFALGELDDAARAELEAALASDPSALDEVAQIQELAAQLESELAAEPLPTLTPDQRASVLSAARPWWRRETVGWAAAAGVGLLVYGGLSMGSAKHARTSAPPQSTATLPPRGAAPVTSTPSAGEAPPAHGYRVDWAYEGSRDEESTEERGLQLGEDPLNGVPVLGTIFAGANEKTGADDKTRTYAELAQLYTNRGRSEDAFTATTRGIELDPDAGGLYALRARLLLQQGDRAGALNDFGRAIELLPVKHQDRTLIARKLETVSGESTQELLGFFTDVTRGYYLSMPESLGAVENQFVETDKEALSTFSVDVDTASYASMRRDLSQHYILPQPSSVRIEELINYFDYGYAPPSKTSEHPFAAHVEVAGCPWNPSNRLVRVGLKGYEVQAAERPASNLVFLLDVSGSMSSERKLPLLKRALRMLVPQLNRGDKVAIVVYAGASGVVLDSTRGDQTQAILEAIERLQSGGSTNGGAGIELAYSIASKNFIEGGINRVILATDGDFNVGVTERSKLLELIERKATSKVFLSVLGFGVRDSADGTMEQLADHGNGVYAYLDTLREAKKVLVDEMSGTLFTIAKDVKLQLEFNPAQVASYRLIGYQNRVLAAQDFNDDTKDAGEIGAGHTVTALYEVVPAKGARAGVDPLRYQDPGQPVDSAKGKELLFLKLRYKQPEGDTSRLMEQPVVDSGRTFAQASQDFRFAASVAGFGMLLRESSHSGSLSLAQVEAIAQENPGLDRHGYRAEFVKLVRQARKISGQ